MNELRNDLRSQLMTGNYTHAESIKQATVRSKLSAPYCSTRNKQQIKAKLSLTSLSIAFFKVCIFILIALIFVWADNLAVGLFLLCALPYFVIYQLMTMKKELPVKVPLRSPAQFYHSIELKRQQARTASRLKRRVFKHKAYVPARESAVSSLCIDIHDTSPLLNDTINLEEDEDSDRFTNPLKRKLYGYDPCNLTDGSYGSTCHQILDTHIDLDCNLVNSIFDDLSCLDDCSLSLD